MGAVKYVSQVGAVAVALGVGGLLSGHGAIASANEGADTGSQATTSQASSGAGHASSKRTRVAAKPRQRAAATSATPGPAAAAPSGPAVRAATIAPRRVTVAHLAVQRAPRPNAPVAPLGDLFAALSQVVRREDAQSTGSAATATVLASPQSPNLLVNGDAETGDPSATGYFAATVPGWQLSGTPTVIKYGTLRRFPWPLATPGPLLPAFLAFPSTSPNPATNKQFFGGGPVATSTLTQTVVFGKNVDNLAYNLSGDLGGFTIDPSSTKVTVNFLDSGGNSLGTGSLSQVSAIDRLFQTKFIHRAVTGTVPVGTVSAQVTVTLTDRNPVLGNYNNAYLDNLSFTVADPTPTLSAPTPTPPPSNVGHLDHVYVIYMENKGYTDIVGSPNAPYFNLLINSFGLASNYYALTHPSDQNYTAAIGGNDFGVNWNCPQDCFDVPSIPDSVEASPNNLTWAGYAQGGQGYNLPDPAVLPYLPFSGIYNDPYRVQTHIFNLDQLGDDLNGPNPANFVWVAADDATNMEGPTEGLPGILQWAVSQILPPALGGHQYNVAAGDEWLQDTVGVIFNSASWQDPNQSSAIFLTFDEDYNNLSIGNGNQGNHVVTVVIPSPGAVGTTPGTMKGGGFVVDDHYNHYSLMRTVEEALGLPMLTNNDRYAVPMNGFWNA